jgi:hypothetical protein
MNKPKYEHIVPRFYLKLFSIENDKKAIYVYDKIKKESKRRKISSIPCEKHFYDLSHSKNKMKSFDQGCENRLSKFENRAKEMFDDLINQIALGIEIKGIYKFSWAVYIAHQIIRGRKIRGNLKKYESNPEMVKMVTIAALGNTGFTIDPFAYSLSCKFQWYIGLNRTVKKLYTSDEPIVFNAKEENLYQGYLHLNDPGKKIYYPLTPEIIIIMEDQGIIKDSCIDSWKYKDLDENEITDYNKLQVALCYKHVFSAVNDFDLAIDLCKKYPLI